jgi:CheY-like chemotaxis protein
VESVDGDSPGESMTNVIIVGGSDETRLLLRGLLRLHRQRVTGEGTSASYLDQLPISPEPTVVVLDVDLEEPEWLNSIKQAIGRHQNLRAVLLTVSRSARVEELAKEAGISALVRRPFAVHELVEAVSPGSTTPPSP